MILNPISIATKGVYANNINLGLASFGYIDVGGDSLAIPAGNSGGFIDYKREEEDIITVIFAFLSIRR